MKKILIPGGRESDLALVNAAHRMGMYVITSGYRPDDPAHEFSDKYIQADYADKEAMLRIAQDENIDYMCSNSNDFGMISTAYVCEKLGLPGHDSYETTLKIHTKNSFKKIAKELKLHSPVSEIFSDRESAIEYIKKSNEKLIIKPSDNVGSNGVSVPETTEEIENKVDLAFENTKNGMIVVEPFIEGFFAPFTSMIINQEVVAFFVEAYREYPQGVKIAPAFPANYRCTGFQIPAPFADEFSPLIIDDINKLAKKLNLVDGKFHGELMITKDHKPYIFDVHRRASGFFAPWSHWDITREICWEDWILKAECGMDLSDFPKGIKQNINIHSRNIYAPKNGLLKNVIFDEYLTSRIYPKYDGKNLSWHDIFVRDYLHTPISENYPESGKNQLYFKFDTVEEAERMCDPNNDEFYSHIKFEYSDKL